MVVDPPVHGAFDWLKMMTEDDDFEVAIYSSRNLTHGGRDTMRRWFRAHHLPEEVLEKLTFPIHKPAAFLTIDDRCFLFQGSFPSTEEIHTFKPWNVS